MGMGCKAVAWLALMVGQTGTPSPEYIRDRSFTIPVHLDAATQAQLDKLVLYVSSDGGRSYQQEAAGTPDQKEFRFRAPADGQYFFILQLIDKQKRATPAEVLGAPANLVVVVDTRRPHVRLQAGERRGGELAVSWQIADDNLDLSQLRLEYRSADQPGWKPARIDHLGAAAATKLQVETTGAVTVRLTAADLAGNSDAAEVEFPSAAVVSPASNSKEPAIIAPPPLDPPATPEPQIVPPALIDPPSLPPKKGGFEPVEPRRSPPAHDGGPRVIAQSDWSPVNPGLPPAFAPPPAPVSPPAATPRPRGQLPPLQYSNRLRVDLEYKVGQVGPSGLKAVELWLSPDDGRTWRRHGEDPDLQSPITAELPAEGVYGFILVTRSGAGLARPDPQPGETPQMRVEIDATPPACVLYQVEADPRRPEFLHLLWNATDRNLAQRPITLKWSDKLNGDWHTIAADIENKGRFAWQIPQGLPFKVYLRLEVRDLAGNVGIATTPEPVLVDLHVPSADLTGVAPAAPR